MTKIATKTATQEALEAIATEAAVPQLPAIRQDRPPQPAKPIEPKIFPGKIAKSIIQITKEIGRIQKEGFNEFQRYKYTRWEDINEKLSPLLAEHGLIVVQSEQSRNLLEENDKGSVLAIVYHFTLINEHGDQWPPVEWTAIARLRDQKGVTDDKAAAKCHTQAEKQFCIKQFKIRTDDFIDGDAHSSLPKKNARDIYQKLQAEIDGAETTKALKGWAHENAERIRVLPNDWQDILRDRYTEKLGDLDNQLTQVLAQTADERLVESIKRSDDLKKYRREIADPETGEIADEPPPPAAQPAPAPSPKPQPAGAGTLSLENGARAAARKGEAAWAVFWAMQSVPDQKKLFAMADELQALLKQAGA